MMDYVLNNNYGVEGLIYSGYGVDKFSEKPEVYLKNSKGIVEKFEINVISQELTPDALQVGIKWVGFVNPKLWIFREGIQVHVNERHVGTPGLLQETEVCLRRFIGYLEEHPVVKRLSE